MRKKRKQKLILNWQHLSFVEYASGIEVYHASLFFKNKKETQKRILDHALDEYRHSRYFYNLAKEKGVIEGISSPSGLINIGGLSKSPFPTNKSKEISFCSYLYVGELRAIEFGDIVKENYSNKEILKIFKIIDQDEKKHAKGLMNYLSTKNNIQVKLSVIWHKIKFIFSDKKSSGLISKLRTKTEQFLVKKIFHFFPETIFETKDNNNNFEEAYLNRKRLS
tara:strand:+ start:1226 stop:1891 length:666 start_codon:yes stop_codon:yes gene_type:complete